MVSRHWCKAINLTLMGLVAAIVLVGDPDVANAQPSVDVLHHWGPGFVGPSALIQAADGDLYGTTFKGGDQGAGTVFKMTTQGALTVLHSFTATGSPSGCSHFAPVSSASGCAPVGGVIQGSDGNFYGLTNSGGISGRGAPYTMTAAGAVTTLHSFGSTGSVPQAGLIAASDGNFYGTTQFGGPGNPFGTGTVIKMTPDGNVTVVHAFGFSGGSYPFTGVIQATDGNLYGTVATGVIYRVSLAGTFTIMYTNPVPAGLVFPRATIIQGADGDFYGATLWGTSNLYQMTPTGAFTVLHSFPANVYAVGALLQAADGNFYGTTSQGGAFGLGTVFRMTPAGTVTTLHSFSGADGSTPVTRLLQASDGHLYGTTSGGGNSNGGVVFRVNLTVPIAIDIKPGENPATINPASNGTLPVALISSATFDASTMIDVSTLTFGRTGNEPSLMFCNPRGADVNHDGRRDLLCHFSIAGAGFAVDDTLGVLKGKTIDNTSVQGSDAVRLVPKK